MRPSTLSIAMLTLSLTRASVALAQSEYDDAMESAARREARGEHREAAAGLDPLAARYPQDYALALRLGWLWFQAGEHGLARRRYESALRLSGDTSHDARLGLAWTLLRANETSDARSEFERLVALDATDSSAREGLSLSRASTPRPLRVWASLWFGAQFYANHPSRSWSLSVTPSVTAQILDTVVIGLTYRAVDYATTQRTTTQPPPPAPSLPLPPLRTLSTTSTALQQELHAMAGIARPNWAIRAHLGRMWDGSNAMAPATAFGVSGRLSLAGDLSAELSDTVFADQSVVRAVAAWSASLSDRWSLGPVASAQVAGGRFGGSIGALVAWRHDGHEVSLAARYGDERRPTSLVEALTWATSDDVRGTLSIGGAIPLGRGLALALRYDGLLLSTTNSGRVDASAHFFTSALTGAW